MKTLLALLLLIPSLSWGDKYFIACKLTQNINFVVNEKTIYNPEEQETGLFYIDLKNKIIGMQGDIRIFEYNFTNETETFISALYETSFNTHQYITIDRYTLDLEFKISESDGSEAIALDKFKCNPISKKF